MKATGHLDSVYCLATNTAGTVVVSGARVSTHAIGLLSIWDPRIAELSLRLKGHTDSIRCVVVSQDGTKCISGSSDATVKLWDIGQQRCIHSFAIHSDSVLSLAADAQFESFISAGRDQHVYCTDIKTLDSICICRTRDPVLKVLLSPDKGVWLSMTNSDIEFWDVERALQSERAMRTTSHKPSVHSLSHNHHRTSLSSATPQEPESTTSQVKVTCYPGSSLSFDGVVLHPSHDVVRPTPTGRPFEITIDRRSSLAHAKDKVYEALCQQQTASNYPEVQAGRSAVALHLLRQCIAPSTLSGNCYMHVYDLVGPEHEDSTPLGWRVEEGLNILIWDGTGEYLGWKDLNLCVGPEAEAMVLSVSYLIQSFVPRDTAPAAGRSPEAKGVWGGAGASAVGIVSGIVGLAGEEEADGPPPDGVTVMARKDWQLKDLRLILGALLQQVREATFLEKVGLLLGFTYCILSLIGFENVFYFSARHEQLELSLVRL
jgi:hypothetical protein